MSDPRIRAFLTRWSLPPEAAADLEGVLRPGVDTAASATFEIGGPPGDEPIVLHPGFDDRGPIGRGAMGEVRRVHDRQLDRVLAMKILTRTGPAAEARFLREARTMARLRHVGILPVHALGRLDDGRLFFTMEEVRGETLGHVAERVHAGSPDGAWGSADGWSLHRLVEAWARACDALACAHADGVLHRDLKPANVMVGVYGQVWVVDWGLAVGRAVSRSGIAGSPGYLAPEVIAGRPASVASDAYGLGATLFAVLADRPPTGGRSAWEALAAVLEGGPPDIRAVACRPVPDELADLIATALDPDPDARPDAAALAGSARGWLDGVHRAARALEVVAEAAEARRRATATRAGADRLARDAARALAEVPANAPIPEKRAGWALDDRAREARRAADLLDTDADALLHAALSLAPDALPAARALADRARDRHAAAERLGDPDTAAQHALWLRRHLARLPPDDATRLRHERYLGGQGRLTLATDPPGATAVLFRHVLVDRRLEPVEERVLGATPLRGVEVPVGSWLVELRHPSRATVRYPVAVGRDAHWDGRPPDGSESLAVPLPPPGALGPDDVYIPPGWFEAGARSPNARSHATPHVSMWADGFVIRRHPVTMREYLAFLDDLVRTGRDEEALAHAPRLASSAAGERGAILLDRRPDGGFALRPDGDGDAWLPDYPALYVRWSAARAFAAWTADRTGLPWRLPGEFEWEKAARGVDGRKYPWGPAFDATWCNMQLSRDGRALPSAVGTPPGDLSPYGVHGTGGNCREWCGDRFVHRTPPPVVDGARIPLPDPEDDDPRAYRVARGGYWFGHQEYSRVVSRFGYQGVWSLIGFRLCRPWPVSSERASSPGR